MTGSKKSRLVHGLKTILGHKPAPTKRPLTAPRYTTSKLRIALFGNCQAGSIAALVRAMTGGAEVSVLDTSGATLDRLRSCDPALVDQLGSQDLILVQEFSHIYVTLEQHLPWTLPRVRRFPSVDFNAYHPDMVYVADSTTGTYIQGPMGEYHSAIALWAWRRGLDLDTTLKLFRSEVYAALGYFDYWPSAVRALETVGKKGNVPLGDLLEGWRRHGCWLYSLNHPKLPVLADVVRRVLHREGIETIPNAEAFLTDTLSVHPAWPVYPEIGRHLGVPGSYLFKQAAYRGTADNPVPFLDLPDYLAAAFATFDQYGPERLVCERLETAHFRDLAAALERMPPSAANEPEPAPGMQPPGPAAIRGQTIGGSPYRDLPDYRFWRRACELVPLADLDPVIHPRFGIGPEDRIATAGSCFAQHISRALRRHRFRFLITERAQGLTQTEAERRQFGVYTARYGNLYTARQLLQLLERAYGQFKPQDHCWTRSDGRLVDAFRPQVEPDGFATVEELILARDQHLLDVRRMFKGLDVFIFTLGLTEAWRSRLDGAVYPLAPGVVAGDMDPNRYEFVNFQVAEVVADLRAFLAGLRSINPAARLLLTVSPVPLIATYEDRHALVATTYSKAVLRVAAEEVVRGDPGSDYFPSYELITGNPSRGAYFEDDLRSVTQAGVDHAMRLFLAHYTHTEAQTTLAQDLAREAEQVRAVICDEEVIDPSAGGTCASRA